MSESLDADHTTYQWDSKNRLIDSISTTTFGNTTSTFSYDMDNNRIAKTVDDNGNYSDITYIVDNNQDYAQVLHEVDNSTLTTDVTYTYGDDLLAQSRAGQLQIYHYDGLGSTRLLTDVNGNTTDAYQYEAFGDLLSQSGFSENNYLFTGEQYDDELGRYYLRARYYDQTVGRFPSMDEWEGKKCSPITTNKYVYANSEPTNGTDPSGKFTLTQQMATVSTIGVLGAAALPNIRLNLSSSQNESSIEKGASVIIGALSYEARKSFCRLFFSGEGDGCEELCEEQYDIDIATCNGISRLRGKSAAARCFKSASERYSACLVGRPVPPLDTWNN